MQGRCNIKFKCGNMKYTYVYSGFFWLVGFIVFQCNVQGWVIVHALAWGVVAGTSLLVFYFYFLKRREMASKAR